VLSASLDATLSLSKLLRVRKGDLSAEAGVEGDEGVAGPEALEVGTAAALPLTRTVGEGWTGVDGAGSCCGASIAGRVGLGVVPYLASVMTTY
jgi:hypothetical protein